MQPISKPINGAAQVGQLAGGGSALERVRAATEMLEALAENEALLAGISVEERARLLQAAGQVYCPDVRIRRRFVKKKERLRKAERQERQQAVLAQTGIRKLRRQPVFTTPNVFPPAYFEPAQAQEETSPGELEESQHCYICKRHYCQVHAFYDQLCPECAALNFRKRTELADLNGRVALLTGGRMKIGYQAGIKLLRSGAALIVTTRFPRDSAERYAREPDFEQWGHRLEIYGLDLRHTPSVEALCQHLLKTRARLDFIIDNACQTVRRPPDFYQHMMARETGPLQVLSSKAAG
jgi:hypothetical protein